MSQSINHTMIYNVLFPENEEDTSSESSTLSLQRHLRYLPLPTTALRSTPLVIFDFETTGLDSNSDRIIEIGGLRVENEKRISEFQCLVKPDVPLPEEASKITGITEDMLKDQPSIRDTLPDFLKFINGAILVAHNADFDMAFLRNESARLGYQIDWPCFCTLKMARHFLPDLDSKSLDTLAEHYDLTFEARHRSIGDCKVTHSVLLALLGHEAENIKTWKEMDPFTSANRK